MPGHVGELNVDDTNKGLICRFLQCDFWRRKKLNNAQILKSLNKIQEALALFKKYIIIQLKNRLNNLKFAFWVALHARNNYVKEGM